MKNKWKRLIVDIATVGICVILFCVIFIVGEIRQPTPEFFLELGLVIGLALATKIMWYDYSEERVLNSEEIKNEKQKYFNLADTKIQDINDFDDYLVILNQMNKNHFISTYIGSRTAKNMAKKNWWMCLWHPSYRKLDAEEIGQIRYNKLYFKALRKADKIKPITSNEVVALSNSEILYDSKNYLKSKKIQYQIFTTIFSTILIIGLAILGIKQIMMNWENVFRYCIYIFSIILNIVMTIIMASKTVYFETLDQIERLKVIIDKYDSYKMKED